ncbi:MAG: Clp protease N-terminal domain-containing protein, partial [bacterium]
MDLNKLTLKAQEALQEAQDAAVRYNHQQVDGEHLLLALIGQTDGLVPRLLERMGVSLNELRARTEQALEKVPRVTGPGVESGKIAVTQRLHAVLLKAADEAARLKDEYVSVEHLIMALAEGSGDFAPTRILKSLGVDKDKLMTVLASVRGNQRVTSATPEGSYEALQKYGTDLVAMAQQGKLDPVIGRDGEIRSVMRILSRKTKNNPVLIGEPGVGKTAIVEGLAHRIVRGDVPEGLKNRSIFALDMTALMAG